MTERALGKITGTLAVRSCNEDAAEAVRIRGGKLRNLLLLPWANSDMRLKALEPLLWFYMHQSCSKLRDAMMPLCLRRSLARTEVIMLSMSFVIVASVYSASTAVTINVAMHRNPCPRPLLARQTSSNSRKQYTIDHKSGIRTPAAFRVDAIDSASRRKSFVWAETPRPPAKPRRSPSC